ncbi:MAG: hypothetical protein FWF10_05105 [Clostridiales bacterium]|nr:hypothetical protein [Clostridiales bacterium]
MKEKWLRIGILIGLLVLASLVAALVLLLIYLPPVGDERQAAVTAMPTDAPSPTPEPVELGDFDAPPMFMGFLARSWEDTVYDENGNKISSAYHQAGHPQYFCRITTSEYDENANMTKIVYWDHDGNERWREEYAYDAGGRIVQMHGTGIDSYKEWRYDEWGNVIYRSSVGMNQFESSTEFDAEGNQIGSIVKNTMGQWVSTHASDGNWSIEEHYTLSGERDKWTKTLYERDGLGYIIKETA